jgi:K319L-like, PKD domain
MKPKHFVSKYKPMLYLVIFASSFIFSCTQDSSNEEFRRSRSNWWHNNHNGGGGTDTTSSTTNQSPVVNAGSDQAITLPANSASLKGTASDPDGTIASYKWTKVSGPAGESITAPANLSTTVNNLAAGTYTFKLEATDDKGATASDNVNVTVSSTTTTPPPTNSSGYTLTYQNGFDTNNDLDPDQHGQIGNGGLSTTTYKTGPGSFHSRPANVSSGIRSEVQFNGGRTSNEGAIEYDVMYNYVVKNQCHSFQFHPNTSGGSASPGLWHVNGQFAWYNWKGSNSRYNTNYTIPTGKWMHIRLEFKFGSSGYLHFYIDGAAVLIKDNIQVGDGSGQYLKLGFNGGFDGNASEAQKSDIYYDNLKIYKKG